MLALLNDPVVGGTREFVLITNTTFARNTADRCAAVALPETAAGPVTLRNVTATANAAAVGDGGALCVAPRRTQVVAALGQTVAVSDHTGDVSVVPPGQLVDTTSPFQATWIVPARPGCVTELTLVDYTTLNALQHQFTVRDVGTVRLYGFLGVLCPSKIPPLLCAHLKSE